MVVHFAGIGLDVVVFGATFDNLEIFARNNHVGSVGATGPFLTVGAMAEGC